MKHVSILAAALGAAIWAAPAGALPLKFNNAVAPTDVANMDGFAGPAITNALSVDFIAVATDGATTVDARVTAVVDEANTHFATVNDGRRGSRGRKLTGEARRGFAPNYYAPNGAAEPNDDLGFLYESLDYGFAGIDLTIALFDGTGALSGTFSTPFRAAAVELLIYDVDGEPSQSEFLRVWRADGLAQYQLGDAPQALTATDEGETYLFTGPGTNFDETDASGALVLRFVDTDQIRLSFGSVANSAGPERNAVFSAIDGDLSLYDPNAFLDPVDVRSTAVPVPAAGALLLTGLGALAGAGFARRRG
ncbi:hypothetical protein [Oceanicella actignis]|uniref:hypothetical protein n=1 Tax=Oceanicella actignis TaxID=1189325 RepID=UPI0011E72B9F|nr:hypothetical protein [Oceanicella actignis]TYO90745.1 putative secreted protein [Oceanicella actignis]